MAKKSIDIDFKKIGLQIKNKTNQAQAWLVHFFKTMDNQEKISTVAVCLGFIMLIIGIIIV